MKKLILLLTCLVALSPITQAAEPKTETGDFTFQTVPITEYWKKQGFSEQLTVLKNTKDESSPGFYFLSDKIAEFLKAYPNKTIKVTTQTETGKEPKVIQIGTLDLSSLSKGAIQKEWSAKMTGYVADTTK